MQERTKCWGLNVQVLSVHTQVHHFLASQTLLSGELYAVQASSGSTQVTYYLKYLNISKDQSIFVHILHTYNFTDISKSSKKSFNTTV